PLHCACFGGVDNGVPAVYLTYVVARGDTVPAIAKRYRTTATDVMSVNDMATADVAAGDIIVLPLPGESFLLPLLGDPVNFGFVCSALVRELTALPCT
uniref:LysM domain-containing protein n=1 Tax=Aegilops tauschii subsp. strangulata TaxID=200361 RepID=A0A453KYV8_AEGTS